MAKIVLMQEAGDTFVFETDLLVMSPPEGDPRPSFSIPLRHDMNIVMKTKELQTNTEFFAYTQKQIAEQLFNKPQ